MDKQADPVAGVAGDAASAAPEADAADRQPSLAKKESGPKAKVTPAEARQEAPAPEPAPEPSVFTPRPRPSNGSNTTTGSIRRPAFLKGGRKRSDATVPMDLASQAGVQKATGGLAAADDDEPDVVDVPAEEKAAVDSTQGASSTLAAAALARELTGAGFATPGFTRQARPDAGGPGQAGSAADAGRAQETRSPSQSPSGTVPPASKPAPSSAVTNPAWTSPAPETSPVPPPSPAAPAAAAQTSAAPPAPQSSPEYQADRPGPSSWTSSSSGPAAPLGSGYAPSAGSAAGPAAAFGVGAAVGAAAADPTIAPQRPEPFSAPPAGPAYPPPLPSENQKAKVGGFFARPGKKKLKPSAGAKPGGAIGNGKAPMSVKSKPGAASRSSAQVAPKSRPEPAGARDAQLVLSRVEPWSVMKFSFMVSLVGFVVLFIVVAVLYYAFSALGVFHSIEQTVGLVTSSKGNPGTNAASWFSSGTVLSYTLIAGTVDVILITALSTVGAVIYNAIARLTGGIEITLAEAD